MAENIVPKTGLFDLSSPPGRFDNWARKKTFEHLSLIQGGRLIIMEPDGSYAFGQTLDNGGINVIITVHHSRFYSSTVFGGAVGFAQAYMLGLWDCDDLTNLIRLLARNTSSLEAIEGPFSWIRRCGEKVFHWLHSNCPVGSQKNIQAHYDLGNDFYQLWLDPTMAYSCGLFLSGSMSLVQAQQEKYKRLCQKLSLKATDHLLEIGTGWGGFAEYAAVNVGCTVTTTTISRQQYKHAKERFQKAGLSEQVTLQQQDYRDLTGQFDKIVSIEMIEAVGHRYIDTFFQCCDRLLKPDGMMVLQAITIADQKFKRYIREVDFIQRYIFPGGCLTSLTHMCDSLTRCTDLRLYDLEDLTACYVKTLDLWRHNFTGCLDSVRDLGYNECFIRMWDYYLCYCQGGFAERNIGLVQMVLTKNRCFPELMSTLLE